MPPYFKETKNNNVTCLNKWKKNPVVRSNKIEVKCTQVEREWAGGLIY